MKLLLALALLFLPFAKRTTNEFSQKYKSHESGGYIVRPGIVMNVKSTAIGDACEAGIKPLASTASKTFPKDYDSPVMPSETAKEIVGEIIPEAKRGILIGRIVTKNGRISLETSGYEKVTITLETRCKEGGGGTYSAGIRWIRDECPDNKPLKWND